MMEIGFEIPLDRQKKVYQYLAQGKGSAWKLLERGRRRRLESLAPEEAERLLVEKDLELAERAATMPMTSCPSLEGYRIVNYCGVISGESVLATGFMSDLQAEVLDVTGTEISLYSQKLDNAREAALTRMK